MNTQAKNKVKRDLQMQKRFNQLYKVERKRIDDVYKILQEEFCLGIDQLQRRLLALKENETLTNI